jgi:hypothetical protein
MKHFFLTMALLISFAGIANSKHSLQTSGNFGFFYSSLSNYGEWIESDYGSAWRPMNVMHGWRPYLNGRWVWTDYGWYWVSNEPFGWATFHYGRWNYDDYYGWIWIPDYDWGPAWVEWCYNDDYIGWAPLSSYATFNVSFGISFSNHWVTPFHYWNFIPNRYFTTTRIVDYIQPVDRNRRIYGESRRVDHIRFEDNRVVNRGVDVNIVERRTNSRINRVDIVNRDRGEGERFVRDAGRERIEVYRPRIENKIREEQSHSTDIRRNEQKNNVDRRNSIQQPDRDLRSFNRDAERERNIRERIPSQRQHEVTHPQQRNLWQEQRQRDVPQREGTSTHRQEQQREQIQRRQEDQRMRDQQMRENRNREAPRYERSEPQIRERQQPQMKERPQPPQRPSERRDELRGNSEKRRRQ